MVLDQGRDAESRPLAELISELLTCRTSVAAPGATGVTSAGAADRIGDTLAYDLALARLCEHLSIDHGLTDDGPISTLRLRAERRIGVRLPSIADLLGAGRSGDDGHEPASVRPSTRPTTTPFDLREER